MDTSTKYSHSEGSGNRGHTGCKSQRIREFSVRLCLLLMSENYTHKVSPAWLFKHELNNNSKHAKGDRESHEASTYTRNYRKPRHAEKQASPEKSTSTDYLIEIEPWIHTYKWHYIDWVGCVFRNMYAYPYVYATTINEKGYEFEKQDGGFWVMKQKGCML